MKKIKYFILLFYFTVSLTFLSFTTIDPQCKSVKNGVFHFYQNNGLYHSIVTRKDSLQTEVNLNTGDSTFWRIVWISDCQFTCSYISGSKIKSPEELNFLKNSTLTFSILKASKRYYTFDALHTFNNNSRNFNDTMWLASK